MNSNEATDGPREAPSSSGQSASATSMAGPAVYTVTQTTSSAASASSQPEVLRLTLAARPSVRWDDDVLDNEGMGRKSSKRCCIFHKQRSFGESSTDSSDDEEEGSDSSSASGEGDRAGNGEKKSKSKGSRHRKIARPKKPAAVPDSQRFHA